MRRIASILLSASIISMLSLQTVYVSARPVLDTYSNQPDETSAKDNFILSNAPTDNRGTATNIGSGEANSTVGATRRALIQFDLSAIPADATINSATLSLWVQADQSTNARNYQVYRLLRNWNETQSTWNEYATGASWTTAGAGSAGNDYSSTSWASTNLANNLAVGTQVNWSLSTTEVKKLIDGTYTNYGWIIRADTESDDGYSFESSSSTTAGIRPMLVIDYTVPTNTPTNTTVPTITNTPTRTLTPSPVPTYTPVSTDTFTPTVTDTPTETFTPTVTNTGVPTDTFTPTITNTSAPTDTFTPTITTTPTETFTPTASNTPSTPVMPTWYIEPQITYGEYMLNISLLALCGVVILVFFTIFIVILIRRKK